jgi:hypothetical protein
MKRRDFMKLVKKAESGPAVQIDEDGQWMRVMEPLEGLALHQERRMVSEAGAITFIRYQARLWSGEWDFNELEDLQWCFKRVDIV